MVIGKTKRQWAPSADGTFRPALSIEIRYTLDDRITEGIYVAHSLQLFRELVQNPERLQTPPFIEQALVEAHKLVEPPPPTPEPSNPGTAHVAW